MTTQRKTESNDDTLNLTWTFEMGSDGVDDDPHNPLARTVARLLRTGQPFKKLAFSFVNCSPTPEKEMNVRWLGAFVFSDGDRLIFFPGYAQQFDTFEVFKGNSKDISAAANIDHLSLEKERDRWHLTTPLSRNHFPGPKVLDLGNGVVLWFGMSITDESVLGQLKKEVVAAGSIPSSDSRRRIEVFEDARNGVVFPIVSLNSDVPYNPSPGFLHFSVIVGPVGFAPYDGPEHGFPHGSPFLQDPLPDGLNGVPVRSHRCSLAPYCDIEITTMKLPGRLKVPISLTSPSTRQMTQPD